ncbi:hypothetical protein UM396_16200 [Geobacillus subterraneus]|uniref:hypothetical protein n=1 Tax=Geobacillus subterraneus TaxID=129338 RepID=UPI002AC96551|nr:hypothetical protein [Geobacillus subterraneus]WPZ18083.1 hypothetical protein UM396_16200 [Geobacillus subterraneus]
MDFGKMTVVTKEGKEEERSILVMSFPYSNAAFAYPLPVENSGVLPPWVDAAVSSG